MDRSKFLDLDIPYRALPSVASGYIVKGVIAQLREAFFTLTTALQQPTPNQEFSRAPLLLCVGAVSAMSCAFTPFREGRGQQFRDCMISFYPWDLDPPVGVTAEAAAENIYRLYRNPFVHSGGFVNERDLGHLPGITKVKFGRLFDVRGVQAGLVPKEGFMKPTFTVGDGRVVLWIDQFYIAIRALVERMSMQLSETEDQLEAVMRYNLSKGKSGENPYEAEFS